MILNLDSKEFVSFEFDRSKFFYNFKTAFFSK